MLKSDRSTVVKYLKNISLFELRRTPNGPFDYGDDKTIMLHLKRVGSTISDLQEDNYGIYLGLHSDGYVVGIKDLFSTKLTGCEIFSTIEEMQIEWQLD